MKIVKEGDTRQVVCETCGLTDATYTLRDIPFSDGSGEVKNLLAAVCNQCNEVTSIPAQSTARIRAEFNKTRVPVDVRVPAHYLDILTLAAQKVDPTVNENFNKALLLYYLHALSTGRYDNRDLADLLKTQMAKAKASKRLSLKLQTRTVEEMQTLMQNHGLKSNTDVVKSIILKIDQDLLQNSNPPHLAELQNFAAAVG